MYLYRVVYRCALFDLASCWCVWWYVHWLWLLVCAWICQYHINMQINDIKMSNKLFKNHKTRDKENKHSPVHGNQSHQKWRPSWAEHSGRIVGGDKVRNGYFVDFGGHRIWSEPSVSSSESCIFRSSLEKPIAPLIACYSYKHIAIQKCNEANATYGWGTWKQRTPTKTAAHVK